MDLINLIAEYGGWSWLVAGVLLLALELVVPGGVFVWFGMAGIITGVFSFVVPSDWPLQWAVFGVLSIGGLAGWLALRKRMPVTSDRPHLNQRAARLVGQRGFLSEPIVGQIGRMELGESVWRVTGPELPAGHLVEVTGFKGNLLEVKSANDEGRVEVA
ncbi:MAG: NfeD family protein [Hyphomicrobiaceae bacterium]|nr:NfeD family protein [Hyphomicrobiaceae bacterium]MCC0024085.1 NfeD family protein [Hyphomicrobiaceae bacterium]